MSGEDKIISKILEDAQASAEQTLQDAEKRVADIHANAAAECASIKAAATKQVEEQCSVLARRKQTVADLDKKKISLQYKKQMLDEVFSLAEAQLRQLPQKDYLAIIEGMILRHAENGDVVVAAAADRDIVTAEFVAGIARAAQLKLTLSPDYGDFSGGIILRGVGVDKNITLEVELQELRDEIQPQIAKLLFD